MLTIDVVSQFDTFQFSSSKINSKMISADDKMSNKTFLYYASSGIFSRGVLLERIKTCPSVLAGFGVTSNNRFTMFGIDVF